MKKIIIVIVIALLAFGYFKYRKPTVQAPVETSENVEQKVEVKEEPVDPMFAKIETCTKQPEGSEISIAPGQAVNGYKTYTNSTYKYSFMYPADWNVINGSSDEGFTARGEDKQCIGGDTQVSNYKEFFSIENAPDDYSITNLMIYKVDPKTTLKGFVNLLYQKGTTVKEIDLNGTQALEMAFPPSEESHGSDRGIVVKRGDQMFVWSLDNLVPGSSTQQKDSAAKIEAIVRSFKLQK
jgi:hypothetical protein